MVDGSRLFHDRRALENYSKVSIIRPGRSRLLQFEKKIALHCTEVRFARFLSGGFTTMALMNPPENKLEKTHLCAMIDFVSILIIQSLDKIALFGNRLVYRISVNSFLP